MKFLFILLMSFGSLMAGSTPVQKDPVNAAVLESFNNAFSNAEEVSWTVSKDYYKASFLFNCKYVFAFFAKDGNLIATTRNMLLTELPVILQTSLKELEQGYWITELFEYSSQEGTSYYVTIENVSSKLILRSTITEWEIYQKKTKY